MSFVTQGDDIYGLSRPQCSSVSSVEVEISSLRVWLVFSPLPRCPRMTTGACFKIGWRRRVLSVIDRRAFVFPLLLSPQFRQYLVRRCSLYTMCQTRTAGWTCSPLLVKPTIRDSFFMGHPVSKCVSCHDLPPPGLGRYYWLFTFVSVSCLKTATSFAARALASFTSNYYF